MCLVAIKSPVVALCPHWTDHESTYCCALRHLGCGGSTAGTPWRGCWLRYQQLLGSMPAQADDLLPERSLLRRLLPLH
ncbi:hypothetical protein C0J52_26763 [Blattella germanica]|nr:hypothetical protein C0J52_26763 [Blattella germanica]